MNSLTSYQNVRTWQVHSHRWFLFPSNNVHIVARLSVLDPVRGRLCEWTCRCMTSVTCWLMVVLLKKCSLVTVSTSEARYKGIKVVGGFFVCLFPPPKATSSTAARGTVAASLLTVHYAG